MDASAEHEGTPVSVQALWMEVDTTDGYQPGLEEIPRFVNDPPASTRTR